LVRENAGKEKNYGIHCTEQDRYLVTKKNDQKSLELETEREMQRKDEKARNDNGKWTDNIEKSN
jgi:hypothetical protein